MRFVNHGLKPCSKCLAARQKVKDMASKVLNLKQGTYLSVVCTHGTVVIDNRTHEVISTASEIEATGIVGKRVYLAGRRVYDLSAAKPIYWLGTIAKITPFE